MNLAPERETTLEVFNPATGERVGAVQAADPLEIGEGLLPVLRCGFLLHASAFLLLARQICHGVSHVCSV